jgi:hypothetical protein
MAGSAVDEITYSKSSILIGHFPIRQSIVASDSIMENHTFFLGTYATYHSTDSERIRFRMQKTPRWRVASHVLPLIHIFPSQPPELTFPS